ncbi:MAG: hypothetical protein KAU22_00830 [Desulfuromonadales bacterium]|nr:hypothetical protein [Desulfuromonadales bacterium]
MGSSSKASGVTVAVCQDAAATSVAGILRASTGEPTLQFAKCEIATNADEHQGRLVQLLQAEKVHKHRAVAVLPPHSYQLTQIEMADLPEDERRDAARWLIRERIDYPPEEVIVDLFAIPPFSGEKKPLTYAVSAQQHFLRDLIPLFDAAELSLESIDIPEFALRNICDLCAADDRGLALLLLLDQRGVLVIVRDGILYLVRWLSSGMDDLLPFADGDFEALTDQLDTIVLEIQRSFDYCESTFHLPLVSRLLVAQTKREIPAVISYLNDYLATKVEALSFADVLAVPENSEQIELNQFLFVIGGALRQENN